MMTTVDVAIVGGGILGSLIAHELRAKDPTAAVTLVERDLIGAGASRRSAGLHFPRGATAAIRDMAIFSQQYWTELLEIDPGLPIHPLPMTLVASPEGAEIATTAYQLAPTRPTTRLPELTRGLPPRSLAWQVEGCHYADVSGVAQRLVSGLRPQLDVREGVRVTGLQIGDESVELRIGTGEQLRARSVVLAPGPWLTEPAWRELVAPLGIRIKQVVAMHIVRPPTPADQIICFHDEDAFLLPMSQHGYWLFSYTSDVWGVEPEQLRGGLSGRELEDARDCLGRLAPELLPYCTGGRVFCDAYSPGREPIVTHLDPAGRVTFAGACNGAGYRLAPAIATRTAELVLSDVRQRSSL